MTYKNQGKYLEIGWIPRQVAADRKSRLIQSGGID